jgi:G3E family GTPase
LAIIQLNNIRTNIITGFLGVGKTTAIQYLLSQKPQHERWAVLVNEFGEIGIDASLVNGSLSGDAQVFLRELPGGCMCCASGLPMQVALNLLLHKAKPDRLLIEPTGLGHPKEVLAVLRSDSFRDVLDVRATLTLVDARKLTDERYLGNAVFQQQLAIADKIIANKADLYQPQDFDNFNQFLKQEPTLQNKASQIVQRGEIALDWLDDPNSHLPTPHFDGAGSSAFVARSFAPTLPKCGYLRIDNRDQGFNSCGWLFAAEFTFDSKRLYTLLLGVEALRLKGVFVTNEGVLGYNKVDEVMTCVHLDFAADSRVELISTDLINMDGLESELLQCLLKSKSSGV